MCVAGYAHRLQGFVLVDRGFSNKLVRQRLEPLCKLISPYHYKSKATLSDKERLLYKKRWAVETTFKALKDKFSHIKLNIRGIFTDKLNKAKLFSALTMYNLAY